MNKNIVSTLDACKVSYRNSVKIIAAVAMSLGHDLNSLVLNTTSYYTAKQMIRKEQASNMREMFKQTDIDWAIIYFDGKLIKDDVLNEKFDRVPIIAKYLNGEKLLNAPALPDGKGLTQAQAIYETLMNYNLTDSVVAICCDTTSSNLGRSNGAAVILEGLRDKDLLFLPCRHHIAELCMGSVFESYMPETTGPDVSLFKKFKAHWDEIDKRKFKSGIFGKRLPRVLDEQIQDLDKHLNDLL